MCVFVCACVSPVWSGWFCQTVVLAMKTLGAGRQAFLGHQKGGRLGDLGGTHSSQCAGDQDVWVVVERDVWDVWWNLQPLVWGKFTEQETQSVGIPDHHHHHHHC